MDDQVATNVATSKPLQLQIDRLISLKSSHKNHYLSCYLPTVLTVVCSVLCFLPVSYSGFECL